MSYDVNLQSGPVSLLTDRYPFNSPEFNVHAPAVQRSEQDSVSLALHIFEECVPLVSSGGTLHYYEDGVYSLFDIEVFNRMFMEFVRKYGIVKAWTRKESVYEALNAIEEVPKIKEFNAYQDLICCENGIVNIATMQLFKHTHEMFFNSKTAVAFPIDLARNFGPGATVEQVLDECPTFKRFLESSLPDDAEARMNLIRLGGYVLDTSNKACKIFFLNGDGGSGKSQMLNIYQRLFAMSPDPRKNQVTTLSLHALAADSKEKTGLITSRLNITAEAKQAFLDAEEIKKIVSGDLIMVSRKFENPITFIPAFKVIVALNGLPRFTDTSEGILRRLFIIDFPVMFRQESELLAMPPSQRKRYQVADVDLPDKLSREFPKIFLLFLYGLRDLRKDKYAFVPSEKAQETIKNYREEIDPARFFLTQNFVVAESAFMPLTEIYDAYKVFYKNRISEGPFKLRMQELGKKVSEVFGIKRVARQYVTNGDGSHERAAMYNLKKIRAAANDVIEFDNLEPIYADER